jgi:ABC-type multidrug transport system ATPase subunit
MSLSYQNIEMDIAIQNISKSFCTKDKVKNVYKDFSCNLPGGKVHMLWGSNGCGKTTLLRIIKGIVPEDSGQVIINDRPMDIQGRLTNVNLKIQTQFERGSWPFLTFGENLSWALSTGGLKKAEIQTAIRHLENHFDLSLLFEKFYKDCNRGTRQMLSALSLLARPGEDIVLLDEPFSYLDKNNIELMISYLESLKSKTIIFTTQDSFKQYFHKFNSVEIGGHK